MVPVDVGLLFDLLFATPLPAFVGGKLTIDLAADRVELHALE